MKHICKHPGMRARGPAPDHVTLDHVGILCVSDSYRAVQHTHVHVVQIVSYPNMQYIQITF